MSSGRIGPCVACTEVDRASPAHAKELRKQKSELEEKITKVVPIQSPPPHLYKGGAKKSGETGKLHAGAVTFV